MYSNNLIIAFEEVVGKYNNLPALKFDSDTEITYHELNDLANRIARLLFDRGVGYEDVVCIAGDKLVQTYASMIACLKIGAIYTILDPDSPVERLRKIISTCQPKLILARSQLIDSLEETCEETGIIFLCNDETILEETVKFSKENVTIPSQITGENPAYIMFTSGSTEFPKGAVMSHRNVLNLIEWSRNTFGFGPGEVLTNVNPLYFDNSVFDFYSSLFTGACLAPFDKETVTDPGSLIRRIDAIGCTSWFSVPSMLIYLDTMKAFRLDNFKSIKRFIFGGEGYPTSKLKSLYDSYGDRAEIYNVYGPTECTCICSCYKISDSDFDDVRGLPPLGEIISYFSYDIINKDGLKVADGLPGELCLSGPNVGKGYYNDTERTELSFVQRVGSSSHQEMMYKTGDLVRFEKADGNLYFLGRLDNQIKHMGYRIELEEIETALSSLEYVYQSAVIHGNSNGLSRIIGVVSGNGTLNEKRLRNDLKKIIPEYMIPAEFRFEESLPKNANGKVDRLKLKDKYT